MINQNRPHPHRESLNILLVGNNPIELSKTLETVRKFPTRFVTTEIAFDLTSLWERLLNFKPNFILIDDNIGLKELSQTVNRLSSSPKTRNVPITVLKNSNYTGSVVTNHISDYVLKQDLTSEALYRTLLNTLRFKHTRQYIIKAYKKRKGQLINLLH